MLNNRTGKIVAVTAAITLVSWSLAFVFAAMAGESVRSALQKAQEATDKSRLVEEQQDVEVAGLKMIEVESSSYDVDVLTSDSPQVRVEFRGRVRTEGPALELRRDGGKIRIGLRRDLDSGFRFGFFNFNTDGGGPDEGRTWGFKITVPKSYAKALIVKAASGDVHLKDLRLADLEVRSASGDIRAQTCEAGSSRLHAASGDVKLEHVRGDMEVEVASGDISMANFHGKNLKVHTSSGDINLTYPEAQKISGSASSGDIRVQLKTGDKWKFNLKSLSGDVHNEWGQPLAGVKTLELRTSSGDISVVR
ncbi:MAG: DUF4097 family beta strand repeat-containing protein [Bdellovibrionales bacterium]